jgi:hypothetical protein
VVRLFVLNDEVIGSILASGKSFLSIFFDR